MTFVIALAVGSLSGWVVARTSPGPFGPTGDMAIGAIGALIGVFAFHLIGLDELGVLSRIVGAGLGAVSAILGLRVLKERYGL